MSYENLLDFKGHYFSAKIKGRKTEGMIQVEGITVYLCQNEACGSTCINRLGYKYSWSVRQGSPSDLKSNSIDDFRIDSVESEISQKYNSIIEKLEVCFMKNNPNYKEMDEDEYNIRLNSFLRGYEWSHHPMKKYDNSYYNGKSYSAKYFDGKNIEGKISIENGRIYLCQDLINGNSCKNKFGYKYSWESNSLDAKKLSQYGVLNFVIHETTLEEDIQCWINEMDNHENLSQKEKDLLVKEFTVGYKYKNI